MKASKRDFSGMIYISVYAILFCTDLWYYAFLWVFLLIFCAYGNCGPTTDFSVSLFQNYIYNMKIEQIYVYTLLLNRSTALLSDIYVYNSALKVIRQKDIAQFNQIYSNCCLLDAWSCDLQLWRGATLHPTVKF